jgi:predicted Zn-dependent peptidase
MKKIFQLTSFMILGALLTFSSQAQKVTPPTGGMPHDFKLSEKKIATLPNGMKTTLVKYGSLPKASIALIVRTGNMHDPSGKNGMADFTGKLIKEGTKALDFKSISAKAASMGGEVSLSVSMEQVMLSGSVLSEFAPEFIKLIGEMVMNPALPESQSARIKDDMLRDLSVNMTVPQNQAEEKFSKLIYGSHPYGAGMPTEAQVKAFTIADARSFHQANFGAKRSIIYVVGQFDEKAVNTAIASGLAKWKSGPALSYPTVTAKYSRDTAIIDRKGAPQTTIQIGGPVNGPTEKDYVAQSITNSLLGGSFGSRITSNIRENKGYTYSPYSYVQSRKGASFWAESADVTSEHTIESIQEIVKEIKKLQSTPPEKEELQSIQNYESGIFVLRNTDPFGIINQLSMLDKYGLPDSYLTNYVKSIYDVTPQQVSQIAKERLKTENMSLVLVGDRQQILEQAKKFDWKF